MMRWVRLVFGVLGSLISAGAGWATSLGLLWLLSRPPDPYQPDHYWSAYAVVMAVVVGVVWLLALSPLYLLVPPTSSLWKWRRCTLCGAGAGALIGVFVGGALDPSAPLLFSGISLVCLMLGAVTGGSTCLFGSLTAPLFRGGRAFSPLPSFPWIRQASSSSPDPILAWMAERGWEHVRPLTARAASWAKARFHDISGQ